MNLSLSNLIGTFGVAILLIAFFVNIFSKDFKDSLVYILMNAIGAGLACAASWLINYMPFVALEGIWVLVSLIALTKYIKTKPITRRTNSDFDH